MTENVASLVIFVMVIILAANAVVGCVMLEWAWRSLKRFRNPN